MVRKKRTVRRVAVAAKNDAERAIAEAAIMAFREARSRLKSAKDPETSLKAYRSVFADFDELTRDAIEAAEEDDEPDVVRKGGVEWRAAVKCSRSYRCTRGEIRVERKLYRAERNGPTRCFFEEKRGVMPGAYLPDLGRAVVEAVAEMPAAKARRLLEAATGHPIASATMKRTAVTVGNEMRTAEPDFFESRLRSHPVPSEAVALVVSVDGLSLFLRKEKWKLAMVATLSLLDKSGGRLKTIRLAEMPQAGKAGIMARIAKEAGALRAQRPDLKIEVVIDGAPDLRHNMCRLFPGALQLTDFFHVMQRVGESLSFLCSDPAEQAHTHHLLSEILKRQEHGGEHVCSIIEQMCNRLNPSSLGKSVIAKNLAYLRGQLDYMKYAVALKDNLDIGSGPVEAACKTLVTQRMKISGAQWNRPGAGAILYLRSVAQSDRLDSALSHLATRQPHDQQMSCTPTVIGKRGARGR